MGLDIKVLFYPKTNEYQIISSDGHSLFLRKEEYEAIRRTPNGIAFALADKAREKRLIS